MQALRFLAVLPALCIGAASLDAQTDSTRLPSFHVGGGVSQFDLSGTGSAPLFVARAGWDWRRNLVLEVGASVSRLDQDFATTTLIIPDAQIQAQAHVGNWRPYFGLGGGIAIDARNEALGGWNTEPVVSASAGARVWFRRWLAARGELRVHGIGSGFEGAAAEWSGGLQWRFK